MAITIDMEIVEIIIQNLIIMVGTIILLFLCFAVYNLLANLFEKFMQRAIPIQQQQSVVSPMTEPNNNGFDKYLMPQQEQPISQPTADTIIKSDMQPPYDIRIPTIDIFDDIQQQQPSTLTLSQQPQEQATITQPNPIITQEQPIPSQAQQEQAPIIQAQPIPTEDQEIYCMACRQKQLHIDCMLCEVRDSNNNPKNINRLTGSCSQCSRKNNKFVKKLTS